MVKWSEIIDKYIAEGRTVSGGCGATNSQEQIQTAQINLMNQASQQMSAEFGAASTAFNDLMGAYTPIIQAGPNQQGFSPEEMANLNSQAVTTGGQSYNAARGAVKAAEAAQGGVSLPSGVQLQTDQSLATSAAQNTQNNLQNIQLQSEEQGRQNFFTALGGVQNAPSVFGTSTGATNAAVGAGSAASTTANQIAQENNSWVGAVTGALGGIGGSFVTGGLSKML